MYTVTVGSKPIELEKTNFDLMRSLAFSCSTSAVTSTTRKFFFNMQYFSTVFRCGTEVFYLLSFLRYLLIVFTLNLHFPIVVPSM